MNKNINNKTGKFDIEEHSRNIVQKYFKDNYYKKKSTNIDELGKDTNNDISCNLCNDLNLSINNFFNHRYLNQKTKKNHTNKSFFMKKRKTKIKKN